MASTVGDDIQGDDGIHNRKFGYVCFFFIGGKKMCHAKKTGVIGRLGVY